MKIIRTFCESCHGLGLISTYEIVDEGTAQLKQVPCDNCGKKGYTEHAVFSIEEAKAILKHCGLSEE